MLVLLSPAKKLDFSPARQGIPKTELMLKGDVATLSKTTARLSRSKLKHLMKISDDLTDLNFQRFRAFDLETLPDEGKQAVLAFNGDVYLGLNASTMDDEDLRWAQDHIRILSGFYGVLRPLDSIHPYRLEMGTRLKTRRGDTLYEYWGDRISRTLNGEAPDRTNTIVNLASNEYFSSVKRDCLKGNVITPVFKDIKDGKARSLFLYAKQARGRMARWIIDNRLTDPERLKQFNLDGYAFDRGYSDTATLVFTRPQPAPKPK